MYVIEFSTRTRETNRSISIGPVLRDGKRQGVSSRDRFRSVAILGHLAFVGMYLRSKSPGNFDARDRIAK